MSYGLTDNADLISLQLNNFPNITEISPSLVAEALLLHKSGWKHFSISSASDKEKTYMTIITDEIIKEHDLNKYKLLNSNVLTHLEAEGTRGMCLLYCFMKEFSICE
jgi:hypothetical protein